MHSHNHFCNGNATVHSAYCLATYHCQQYNNIRRYAFLWRIPFAERNRKAAQNPPWPIEEEERVTH